MEINITINDDNGNRLELNIDQVKVLYEKLHLLLEEHKKSINYCPSPYKLD